MALPPNPMRTSRQRQPTFFWQGVLIVLPVVLLAGAAVWSLRQDRLLARHEATERAEELAQETASALWSKLTARESLDQFKDHTFRVDAAGRLVFPPPAPALPTPQVLDPSALNPTQRASWMALRHLEFDGSQRTQAIAAARRLLDLNPPESFAAVAQFRLGQSLAAAHRPAEAVAAFTAVRERFPDARGESGIPLGPLADLKSFELQVQHPASNAVAGAALNVLCSNLVSRPSFFSEHLLTRAEALETSLGLRNVVEPWRREWERQDSLRALAAEVLRHWEKHGPDGNEKPPGSPQAVSPVPAFFWFEALDPSPRPQPVFYHERMAYIRSKNGSPQEEVRSSEAAQGTNPPAPPAPADPQQRLLSSELPSQLPRQWLATRIEDGHGGHAIVCRVMGIAFHNARTSIGSPAWLDLRNAIPTMPPWFGATVDLAGMPLANTNDLQVLVAESGGKGSGQAWKSVRATNPQEVLAVARRLENGVEQLRVNIHLVGADLLFARQRTRTYLFALLIAASAVAAITGFVSARRAFVRQQQLGDMKSNFVSSVSHELRAPIASVRLLAESLERGRIAEPARQNEYFRFIVQECRRLSSLIENVLDFARIEQGRKQYEFEPADVVALVSKTVKLFEPVAGEKHVTLQLQLPEQNGAPMPEPVLDAPAIQQALVNLLDNAVKHAPAGSEVTVGLDLRPWHNGHRLATPESANGAFAASWIADEVSVGNKSIHQRAGSLANGGNRPVLCLWVQDHGRGIPSEEHQRIFERFYRPGSEMRRETQGVGIGLSIVKHIVEAHRGQVSVQSEPGNGSRFTITLPLSPTPIRTNEGSRS